MAHAADVHLDRAIRREHIVRFPAVMYAIFIMILTFMAQIKLPDEQLQQLIVFIRGGQAFAMSVLVLEAGMPLMTQNVRDVFRVVDFSNLFAFLAVMLGMCGVVTWMIIN